MSEFVILQHETPARAESQRHWDLMLSDGQQLLTWALDDFPESGKQYVANRLPDHRLDYLEYEGPISQNRGHVKRIVKGRLEWRHISAHRWEAVLDWNGTACLLIIESVSDRQCRIMIADHGPLGPGR